MIVTAIASAMLAPAPAAVSLKRVASFQQHLVSALAASPVNSQFAFGCDDSVVRVYDPSKTKMVRELSGHPFAVTAVAFNWNGTQLATADESARLYIWDLKTGKKIREFPRDKGHKRGIIFVAWSQDNQRLATVGEDESIMVWRANGGHPIGSVQGVGENFYGIAFTPGGGFITGNLLDELRIYSPNGWARAATMKTPGASGINSIAMNRAGTMALTAGRDGRVVMFNPATRKRVGSGLYHDDWAVRVAIAPNSRLAASSGSDRKVVIWDTKTFKPVTTVEDTGSDGSPVAFSGDGKFFGTTTGLGTLNLFALNPPQAAAPTKAPAKKATRRRR